MSEAQHPCTGGCGRLIAWHRNYCGSAKCLAAIRAKTKAGCSCSICPKHLAC